MVLIPKEVTVSKTREKTTQTVLMEIIIYINVRVIIVLLYSSTTILYLGTLCYLLVELASRALREVDK